MIVISVRDRSIFAFLFGPCWLFGSGVRRVIMAINCILLRKYAILCPPFGEFLLIGVVSFWP